MDVAQISLFSATEEQARVHRKRSGEEWGRGMEPDEYARRDEAFEASAQSESEKFIIWVLAPRSDSSTLDFFCSCETSRREVAVFSIEKPPLIVYGITSVLTPTKNRRKGYAKHMMRLLHYVLADQRRGSTFIPTFPLKKWGAPPVIPSGFGVAIGSILHSDVGESFYQSCGIGLREDNGWIVHSPSSTVWLVPEQYSPEELDVEWITKETQDGVWEKDAELIMHDIQRRSYPCFAFLPDKGVARYQQTRGLFFTPEIGEGAVWGAQIMRKNVTSSDSDSPPLSFVTWCLGSGGEDSKTLFITRLRCTQAQFPTLLTATFQAARNFKLEKIEIWNLEAALCEIGAKLEGKTFRREKSVSCLAWYGSNNGDEREQKIEWLHNEKFCALS